MKLIEFVRKYWPLVLFVGAAMTVLGGVAKGQLKQGPQILKEDPMEVGVISLDCKGDREIRLVDLVLMQQPVSFKVLRVADDGKGVLLEPTIQESAVLYGWFDKGQAGRGDFLSCKKKVRVIGVQVR